MKRSAALSDKHPDPAKRRDGPRTNVQLCGIAYAVLGGGFINKWFKEEDPPRDPDYARPGDKMVSESPCYFASNRVPWPGAPTKWFKTMKYAEGAQFDMERRPQR